MKTQKHFSTTKLGNMIFWLFLMMMANVSVSKVFNRNEYANRIRSLSQRQKRINTRGNLGLGMARLSYAQLQQSVKWLKMKNFPLGANPKLTQGQSQLLSEELSYYSHKYDLSFPETMFCVVVPSYKNFPDRYRDNLNSIFQQNYTNFHVAYIDDASLDGTSEAVREYIRQHNLSSRITLVENEHNRHALPNIHYAIHNICKSGEIVAIIDGDDELVGRQIFKLFNSIYHSKGVWAAYGNYLKKIDGMVETYELNNYGVGASRDYTPSVRRAKSYRSINLQFIVRHLRTFHRDLFVLINDKDLKDDSGEWFRTANDMAIVLPIVQMCGEKFTYVPELTYKYNSETGLNNHIVRSSEQFGNDLTIRKRKVYPTLPSLPILT